MQTKASKEEEKVQADGPLPDVEYNNLNNIEGHSDFTYDQLLDRIFKKLKIDTDE